MERKLAGANEVALTIEASSEVAGEILAGLTLERPFLETRLEEKGEGLTSAYLKSDCEEVYDITRKLFFAFASKGVALLEIAAKKANLEDIFIELTEETPPLPSEPGETDYTLTEGGGEGTEDGLPSEFGPEPVEKLPEISESEGKEADGK